MKRGKRADYLVDQPEMICIGTSAGTLDDSKEESFRAVVTASPPKDPTNEDHRLEKGLTMLISILREKLGVLQTGNKS
jgi:hypothetical protein